MTNLQDPIFSLGGVIGPVIDDGKDRGIEFRYYDVSSGSMKLGWFGYKVDSNKFTLITDATNTNETITGNVGRNLGSITKTATGYEYRDQTGKLIGKSTLNAKALTLATP